MGDSKAKARQGLVTHDHSKRGRRFVTILDGEAGRVTLLEPWEHAILVLCDGTRTPRQMLEILDHPVEGETVDLRAIQRCLKFFERQELIDDLGLRSPEAVPAAGPKTLAGLQHAYREWHKDPVKTGQILAGVIPAPFTDPSEGALPVGLEPTVALPDDEDDDQKEVEQVEKPRTRVAVGTTLVLGDSEDAFGTGAMKSLLAEREDPPQPEKRDEPETVVGDLSGERERAELEEDELELGDNVSDLLAAVDNDFAEVEKREQALLAKAKPPPVGQPVGGVAEIPRTKSFAKASEKVRHSWIEEPEKPKVLEAPALPPAAEDREENSIPDEPTMRSIPYSEAALNPTMVGVPAEEGDGPVILSPSRGGSRAGERVGAVVGPGATSARRNMSSPSADRRQGSDISVGALVEDTMRGFDDPTEGAFGARHPLEVDSRNAGDESNGRRNVTEPMEAAREETTSSTSEHIAHGQARAVFELLRKAGLKARSYAEDIRDGAGAEGGHARRKNDKGARRFEKAIVSLTAGDLGLALAHFRALLDQTPDSKRLKAFIGAIEAVRDKSPLLPSILDDFEGALEDAIAYGRCPKCFSMMAPDESECFACGFRLSRTV